MRKTLTLNASVIETASRARHEGPLRDAIERRTGRAASTEAATLAQLAEIGASVVREDAATEGYFQLAEMLAEDPAPDVQVELGAPIAGEDPTQFDALFEALAE